MSAADLSIDNTDLDVKHSTPKDKKLKVEWVLELALLKGPVGFTQPEAYNQYQESCLHTSISSLQNEHGILV